jgi:hypothetical protein
MFGQTKDEAFNFRNEEVNKIVKLGASSSSSYRIAGLLLGIPTGALIGVSLADNSKEGGAFIDPSNQIGKIFGGILGGLIGSAFGYLIGTAIDNSITVDKEFTANADGCFCHLDEYTILSMSLRLK